METHESRPTEETNRSSSLFEFMICQPVFGCLIPQMDSERSTAKADPIPSLISDNSKSSPLCDALVEMRLKLHLERERKVKVEKDYINKSLVNGTTPVISIDRGSYVNWRKKQDSKCTDDEEIDTSELIRRKFTKVGITLRSTSEDSSDEENEDINRISLSPTPMDEEIYGNDDLIKTFWGHMEKGFKVNSINRTGNFKPIEISISKDDKLKFQFGMTAMIMPTKSILAVEKG